MKNSRKSVEFLDKRTLSGPQHKTLTVFDAIAPCPCWSPDLPAKAAAADFAAL